MLTDTLVRMLQRQHPIEVLAGENIEEGEICKVSQISNGRVTVSLANATTNAAGAAHILFIADRKMLAGQLGHVVPLKVVEVTGLTPNNTVFLSDTPGAISGSAGTVSRAIGWSVTGGYVFTGSL